MPIIRICGLMAVLAALPLAARPGTLPSPLVFSSDRISAPVVPGASSVWFGATSNDRRLYLRLAEEVDTDRDGWAHRALPVDIGIYHQQIWTVVDMSSGRLMAGEPFNKTIPRQSAFPAKMFLRDPSGKLAHVSIDVRGMHTAYEAWWLMWVRPGVGAWFAEIADSQQATRDSAADLDGVLNNHLLLHASSFGPAGTAPTPVEFQAGDVLIGIDAGAYFWFGDAVTTHLGEASGPGVLSAFPSGNVSEKIGIARVTVLRREGADGTVSVGYATADGTGVAGVHYQSTSGTLEFAPGELVKTIEVPLINDLTYSGNTTFRLALTTPAGAPINGPTSFSFLIAEDDPAPKVSVLTNVTRAEGGDGTHEVTLDVRLEGATRLPATMEWVAEPSAGTVAGSGSLTFAPGETQKLIAFSYAGNTLSQPDRTYRIYLQNVQNATPGESATVTVADDDVHAISVSNAHASEWLPGIAYVHVNAIGTGKPWSFTYTTVDGTAKAGKDYEATSGTIHVPANSTSATIMIRALQDLEIEGEESFQVVLSNPVGAVITGGAGTVTIHDDDSTFRVLMPQNAVPNESADATISVTIGNPSPYEISFVATTRSFTATAGTDFVPASATLRIPPGQTSVSWTIDVIDDAVFEPEEMFFVDLSNLVNATLGDYKSALVIIRDDDAPANPQTPVLTIVPVSVVEGNSGRTMADVRLELSPAPVTPITVRFTVGGGTATRDSDYLTTAYYETFQPGETVKSFPVAIYGDTLVEPDETFRVTINAADGAIIANSGAESTIVNDDAPPNLPTLTLRDASTTEGSSGSTMMRVLVELSAPPAAPLVVSYATSDGTAQAGSDYAAVSSTLTFVPGETMKAIQVPVFGDAEVEPDETLTVSILSAPGTAIAKGTAAGTIVNDDEPGQRKRRSARH